MHDAVFEQIDLLRYNRKYTEVLNLTSVTIVAAMDSKGSLTEQQTKLLKYLQFES